MSEKIFYVEKILQKIGEISYKIYENLRSIEKLLRKFVRNIGQIFVQSVIFQPIKEYLY